MMTAWLLVWWMFVSGPNQPSRFGPPPIGITQATEIRMMAYVNREDCEGTRTSLISEAKKHQLAAIIRQCLIAAPGEHFAQ